MSVLQSKYAYRSPSKNMICRIILNIGLFHTHNVKTRTICSHSFTIFFSLCFGYFFFFFKVKYRAGAHMLTSHVYIHADAELVSFNHKYCRCCCCCSSSSSHHDSNDVDDDDDCSADHHDDNDRCDCQTLR